MPVLFKPGIIHLHAGEIHCLLLKWKGYFSSLKKGKPRKSRIYVFQNRDVGCGDAGINDTYRFNLYHILGTGKLFFPP